MTRPRQVTVSVAAYQLTGRARETALAARPAAGTVWVGVDPGDKWTGITVRRDFELLGHTVLERADDADRGPWAGLVVATVAGFLAQQPAARVAVEDVTPPSPHLGLTNVGPALGTAVVLGAVLGRWPDAVVVRPNRHGSRPLAAYPDPLVAAAERRGAWRARVGTGVLRHARSGWDVAGAAHVAARLDGGAR